MEVEILYCVQEWYEEIRTLPELRLPHDILLDSEKDRWLQKYLESRSMRKDNFKYVQRAHRRLQSWSRRMARAQRQTEQRLYYCELPSHRKWSQISRLQFSFFRISLIRNHFSELFS